MSTHQESTDDDVSLDDVDTDDIAELIDDCDIDGPDDETLSLPAVIEDLAQSHEDLDSYKRGALTMCASIDDRLQQAEREGDEALAALLRETKRTAFGVYLRVQRGDAELFGDRGGEYEGYFGEEVPLGVDDDVGAEDP